MKKIFILLINLYLAVDICNAQNAITLTNADKPTIGKTYFVYHDTSTFFHHSINDIAIKSGADQEWDFSELSIHKTDTIEYIDPLTTGYSNLFSHSTVAARSSVYDYVLFINTMNDAFELDGVVNSSTGVTIDYSSPIVLITYPTTYLDTFNHEGVYIRLQPYGKHVILDGNVYVADSAKKIVTTKIKSTMNAYGKLITPAGQFNTLKQYLEIEKSQETYFLINGTWALYKLKTNHTYKMRWWANDYAFPVMECSYRPSSGIIRSISFLKKDDPLTTIYNLDNSKIMAFPNPASDYISIHMNFSDIEEKDCSLTIYNSQGGLMYETKASLQEKVSVLSWRPGTYFFRISNPEGKVIHVDKFNITR